ncbi:hypothetical protein L3Q82_000835 [Scortum barcoo]|uniref:Uncharacterized protein n=1 Tax=Scortum barcoo TaxID=214431 RepID=A0ACB8WDJ3_9TELE|nr:hypothetical protein L3Q82_000835 [Scortum barcoo]
MQQHVSAGELASQSGPADAKISTPNGHWTENHHHPNNHHHPHAVLKHLSSLLGSSQQWQLQQDQHPAPQQPDQQGSSFESQLGQTTTNGSYIPNGHAAFPPNAGYNIPPHPGGAVLNGASTPEVCFYQRPCQLQQMLQQTPPSGLPAQSSALELEQLLGLSSPPSLEAYSMFNTAAHDSTHSKLENGCLLSATNAAYIRTCLMPNGNGVTTGDISCPDRLPALHDPQKSGFFL